MLVGSLGERFPYFFIARGRLGLCRACADADADALLLFIGMAAFSAGIATPAWFDMIAKVIPVQRRGIWSGIGHGVGALLGCRIGAYVVAGCWRMWPIPTTLRCSLPWPLSLS